MVGTRPALQHPRRTEQRRGGRIERIEADGKRLRLAEIVVDQDGDAALRGQTIGGIEPCQHRHRGRRTGQAAHFARDRQLCQASDLARRLPDVRLDFVLEAGRHHQSAGGGCRQLEHASSQVDVNRRDA